MFLNIFSQFSLLEKHSPVRGTIVNADMVWKFGELQNVYNELSFYVELASPRTNLLKFCLSIFQCMVDCFSEATLLNDCFITPKIHCLYRAQVSINTNKKIEQRR